MEKQNQLMDDLISAIFKTSPLKRVYSEDIRVIITEITGVKPSRNYVFKSLHRLKVKGSIEKIDGRYALTHKHDFGNTEKHVIKECINCNFLTH